MPACPKRKSAASGTSDRSARPHPYGRAVRPGEVISYQPDGGAMYCPRPRRIIKHNQWNIELFERYLLLHERGATSTIDQQSPASSIRDAKRNGTVKFPQQNRKYPGPTARDQRALSSMYETPGHYPYLGKQSPAKNIKTHQASLTTSVGYTSNSNWSILPANPLVSKIRYQYQVQQEKKNLPEFLNVTISTEDKGYDGDVEEAYRMEREVLDLEHAIRYYQFCDRHRALYS